jgi:Cu/Zn superoxide dismutase
MIHAGGDNYTATSRHRSAAAARIARGVIE